MMDELGPDERQWLDALRSEGEPTSDDRARVRAAVLAGISSAAGATATTAAAVATSGVAKGATVGTVFTGWKMGLTVIALGLAGAITSATLLRVQSDPPAPPVAATAIASPLIVGTPPPVVVDTPPPVVDVASSAEPAAEPEKPTAARARSIESARPSPPRVKPRTDDVDAELLLLTQAQRALERGEPSAALTLLAEHGREHPSGALALERDGLRAIASCDAKHVDGRTLAERFIAAHPSSPLVARIRTSCLSP